MFAVIRTGGKQYRVSAGDRLKVESLPVAVGQQVQLAEVLALGEGGELRVGAPLLPDASVKIGNFGCRSVDKLLRLAHVQNRIDAVFLERLGQVQRFLAGSERLLRNIQF